MEQDTILLNGGHDHEVDCLDAAGMSLVRLLGGASLRPAVPFLRTMPDSAGQQCVAVFIGSQHVGYLPQPVNAGLLATVQACEMNGAVARAKGNLVAAWDCPGKVRVKVSLADAEHLLHRPEPESPAVTDSTTFELPACLDDSPAFGAPSVIIELPAVLEDVPQVAQVSRALEDAAAPPQSAGWTDDYPDWPPPKPKSAMPVRSLAETSSMESVGQAPTTEPSAIPTAWMALSNGTGWLAGASATAQTPEPGWLISSARAPQALSPAAEGDGPAGPAARKSDAVHSLDDEIIAAWTSAPLRLRPATA
jgi:hypothetical protein